MVRNINLEYLQVLERCEQDDRTEMLRYQSSLLERLCRHACKTVPFYRKRLDVLFDAQDRFSLTRWDEVPVLSRRDIMENRAELTSTAIPSNFGNLLEAKSSGSTGQPVALSVTDMEYMVSNSMMHRFHQWHGFQPHRLMALIYAIHPDNLENSEAEYWTLVYKNIGRKGRLVKSSSLLSVPELVAWLDELKPDYLAANARLTAALAQHYLDDQREPPFTLHGVRLFGETRTPHIDQTIFRTFGVKPRSLYTADETGHLAVECPMSGHYHVCDEIVRIDIADQTGRLLGPDMQGRVLVTNLYGYAVPRIKYDIGDEASWASSCPCGRPYATIQEIAGRAANMFIDDRGALFWPERRLIEKIRLYSGAVAVQIVQKHDRSIKILLKPDARNPMQIDKAAIAEQFKISFGFQPDLNFIEVYDIPAKRNGKREDFISEALAVDQTG